MKNIIWVGSIDRSSGIGRAGYDYLSELQHECNIKLITIDGRTSDLGSLTSNSISGEFDLIIHGLPTPWEDEFEIIKSLKKKARKKTKLFAWETTPIPEQLWDHLNEFDKLIVPSDYCKSAIENSNITSKIVVIPHLIYPDTEKDLNLDRSYILFFFSQFTERKGSLKLPKVIKELIYNNIKDDIIIKIPQYNDIYQLKKMIPPYSNCKIVYGNIKEEMIRMLYKNAKLVCNLSIGEGFGYSYYDPPTFGTPIVAPNFSDNLWYPSSISNWTYSYPWKFEPASNLTYEQCGINIDVSKSNWIDFNEADVAEAILKNIDTRCDSKWEGNIKHIDLGKFYE